MGPQGFTVHTDSKIDENRPGITTKDFREQTCIMLDVTAPAEKNISLKECGKLSKYKDLEIEVIKMWKLKDNFSGNRCARND